MIAPLLHEVSGSGHPLNQNDAHDKLPAGMTDEYSHPLVRLPGPFLGKRNLLDKRLLLVMPCTD